MKKVMAVFFTCLMTSLVSGVEIKSDETVVFYPTYAFLSGSDVMTINIHGSIYEPEEDSLKRSVLLRIIAGTADIEEGDPGYPLFAERTKLFLVDNKGGKDIRVRLGGGIIDMPESDGNGHFAKSVVMKKGEILPLFKRNLLHIGTVTVTDDGRKFTGEIRYIPTQGISVISDIDDTIKISNVLDKKELAKNTFTRPFRSVPGMADQYRSWTRKGAVFHYVSGSPWQLYEPVRRFMDDEKFPRGSMHLKNFRLKDSSALDFLTADQREYKIGVISSIINDFPERRFILVGDSGENDPEVYAEIVKKYGRHVKAVCIRDVKNPADKKDRFTGLFGNYRDTRFILFRNGRELQYLLR
ncbi:MAG: hypothetical protein CVV44_07745 [Spirochaetae bacterium HGW-Spirochaetae-1]|jgi:uncharacterized protein YifE (UPF0438 family)|nr:MAG: hypothetical protein CVV44_07745 [Spirochaetae bacterium HGW-Spirochaetae-1]